MAPGSWCFEGSQKALSMDGGRLAEVRAPCHRSRGCEGKASDQEEEAAGPDLQRLLDHGKEPRALWEEAAATTA